MKKQLLLSFILLFFVSAFSQAQSIQFLGHPDSQANLRTTGSGGGSSDEGTIYYGSVPSNSSSKPVLLFVHGYSSSASTWWDGNDMYSSAYYAGYRTAFVSLGPDKSSYHNGEMLSGMINTITAHYGVGKVAIIAHSKGGVDTDAALVHYNARHKVSRIVSLGSPHFGTPLADLAQSSWTWWLAAVFGQYNDGTHQLQTGVMSNFRNDTDNNSNNAGIDYRTIGAWGYSGSLLIPGWYLNTQGGGSGSGGNDGVVPYWSTKRPNSSHLLGGYGDSRTDVNHFEIAEGNHMWQYIQPQIAGASNNRLAISSERINPTAKIISSAQVIAAESGEATFTVEKGAKMVFIDIKQAQENTNFTIKNNNGTAVFANQRKGARVSYDELLGSYSTQFNIEAPEAGEYTIFAEEGFVAVIGTENGVSVELTSDLNDNKFVYNTGETMNFNVGINGAPSLVGAQVSGVMLRTSDLKGNPDRGDEAYAMEFTKEGDHFALAFDEALDAGVYNISINVQGANYRKSIITSIAVKDGMGTGQLPTEKSNSFDLMSSYPNPTAGETTISFVINQKSAANLTIYNAFGQQVKQIDLSDYDKGSYQINWTPESSLSNGMYIYELRNSSEKVSKKMLLVR